MASTKDGSARRSRARAAVTCGSCTAASEAACGMGGVRLISSARMSFAESGRSKYLDPPRSGTRGRKARRRRPPPNWLSSLINGQHAVVQLQDRQGNRGGVDGADVAPVAGAGPSAVLALAFQQELAGGLAVLAPSEAVRLL